MTIKVYNFFEIRIRSLIMNLQHCYLVKGFSIAVSKINDMNHLLSGHVFKSL